MMIQGVLGPIDTAELGQTLMHEHITCADWSMRMNFGARFFEFDQVAEIAAGQLGKAKALGVRTVVDGTPVNLGRDIRLIREVARRTGLNFIASTGFYYQEEPWLYFRDEEEIYDLLMGDCADGISGTGSKPGLLKAGVVRRPHSPAAKGAPTPPAGGEGDRPASVLPRAPHGRRGDSRPAGLLQRARLPGSWAGGDTWVPQPPCWSGLLAGHGPLSGFCDRDLGLEPRVDTIAALCRAGHRPPAAQRSDLPPIWPSGTVGDRKHLDWLHLEEDYTHSPPGAPASGGRGLSRADIDRLLTGNPCAFFEGV